MRYACSRSSSAGCARLGQIPVPRGEAPRKRQPLPLHLGGKLPAGAVQRMLQHSGGATVHRQGQGWAGQGLPADEAIHGAAQGGPQKHRSPAATHAAADAFPGQGDAVQGEASRPYPGAAVAAAPGNVPGAPADGLPPPPGPARPHPARRGRPCTAELPADQRASWPNTSDRLSRMARAIQGLFMVYT